MKKWTKIEGRTGWWFAKVFYLDGTTEELPCAHARFWQNGNSYQEHPYALDCKKAADWFAAAHRLGRVIVTRDDVKQGTFSRTGYKGIFNIADLRVDVENGLCFKFAGGYAIKA